MKNYEYSIDLKYQKYLSFLNITGKEITHEKREELKQAFFAGFGSAIDMMVNKLSLIESDAEASNVIDEIQDELFKYFDAF